MVGRLKRILIKEFRQMLRDQKMRAVVLVTPVLQMLIFAFALNVDVTNVRTAVLDYDDTASSRELVQEFSASGYFEIVERLTRSAQMADVLDRGIARAVIHVPAGFANDLFAGKTAKVQVVADGTESTDANVILGYADEVVGRFSMRKTKEAYERFPGRTMRSANVAVDTRAWFNPNMESKFYYVPGLIAMMMMVVTLILTSLAIVREKEIGTIEQLMVTPIGRLDFILGKTLPYLATGYLTMTAMFILALVVFGVRIQGSALLLYVVSGIYLAGNLGIALTISAGASTQQQALLTAFLVMMPGTMLSGYMFPIRNMPEVVQWITLLNPLRWFLEILYGITLKGVGVETLWPQILAQTALAVGFILLAVSRFKKTLAG